MSQTTSQSLKIHLFINLSKQEISEVYCEGTIKQNIEMISSNAFRNWKEFYKCYNCPCQKTSYIIQAVCTILLLYHNSYSLKPLPEWSPYFHSFWNCTDCVYLHCSSVVVKYFLHFKPFFFYQTFSFFYLHFSIIFFVLHLVANTPFILFCN